MADLAAPAAIKRSSLDLRALWSAAPRGEVTLAVGVIGIVLLLVLPIPAMLVDLLLAVSIVSAVLILMTALLIKKPLEFTAFPTVLLVCTLYRLGLNIASTRLILSHGHEGGEPAGARSSRLSAS